MQQARALKGIIELMTGTGDREFRLQRHALENRDVP